MSGLKPHEIAKLFPRPVGDERASMLNDIKAKGVLVPMIVKNGVIYDGFSRYELALEAGIPEENIPRIEYNGTEAEALAYAVSLNLQRRQLTSSQRAAIAVDADGLARKYHRNEGGEDPNKGKELGDIAERIAAEAGTNRTYVFHAQSLKGKHNDLLRKVRDGEMTIPQAMKEARKRDGSSQDGEGEGDGGGEENGTTVLDGNGNPVPKKFHKVFLARTDYKASLDTIRTLKEHLKETIGEGEAADCLDQKEVQKACDDVAKIVRGAQPHVPHDKCRNRGCAACGHKGWLSKLEYDTIKALEKKQQKDAEAETDAVGAGVGDAAE